VAIRIERTGLFHNAAFARSPFIVNSAHEITADIVSDQPPARVLGWTLTILFLTTAGVLNAVVLTWVNVAGGSWPQPATILGLALVFAQQGLVALACGFGRQHFAFRAFLFVAASAFSSIVASRYEGRPDLQGTWLAALLVHSSGLLLVSWYLRARGCELRLPIQVTPPRSRPWQFSLAKLFALTTTVAILLAMVIRWQIELRSLPLILFVAFVLGMDLMLISLQLGGRATAAGVAWGFIGTGLLAVFLGYVMQDTMTALWLALSHSLLVQSSLGIIRLAGFQLVRVSNSRSVPSQCV
jgi:hypothetical protein